MQVFILLATLRVQQEGWWVVGKEILVRDHGSLP